MHEVKTQLLKFNQTFNDCAIENQQKFPGFRK